MYRHRFFRYVLSKMKKGTYIQGDGRAVHVRASDVFRVAKAWGEEQWIVNKEYCGKKLILRKNHRCSLHKHAWKDEVFYVQSGKVKMEIDGKRYILNTGDFVHIQANKLHRFTGLADSEIIEFSTNHQEDDSYRTELSGHVEQERYDRQAAIVRQFQDAAVLVLGDAMLDTYVSGHVARISPEAPVPVVQFEKKLHVPGGAANAAANVSSLGGEATLIGVCGKDRSGAMLVSLLKKHGVRLHLLEDRSRCTTEKERVVAGDGHQLVRVDYEKIHALGTSMEKRLLSLLRRELPRHRVLLLSDYAKGVFHPSFLRACLAAARKAKIPVILDPKPSGADYLRHTQGVALLTPNRHEAQMLADDRDRPMAAVTAALAKKLSTAVLSTLGGDGMLLASANGDIRSYPALATGVVDVSGAGDTVAATLALSLAAEAGLEDAVDLANRAASVVVEKAGTAVLTSDELLCAL